MDLSSISLDLGGSTDVTATGGSGNPEWQEVATKLDLAKAYEEMGDKDGARELLNEVMKDGDAAERPGSAVAREAGLSARLPLFPKPRRHGGTLESQAAAAFAL